MFPPDPSKNIGGLKYFGLSVSHPSRQPEAVVPESPIFSELPLARVSVIEISDEYHISAVALGALLADLGARVPSKTTKMQMWGNRWKRWAHFVFISMFILYWCLCSLDARYWYVADIETAFGRWALILIFFFRHTFALLFWLSNFQVSPCKSLGGSPNMTIRACNWKHCVRKRWRNWNALNGQIPGNTPVHSFTKISQPERRSRCIPMVCLLLVVCFELEV